ncbi:AraC family transcriptional regulator [Flexivirga oryzae]|uniref:AraC-like DNA-binding protein n=1 Tax=Flexivirga oryzae TaxID=1794944 RepID=A0A839N345_9MICO|nr:AraC family transcriptional regulator [Flexivirga oryzae]MBB2890504.1 AraC-like DNA-binding protein [Flexivirga oryzae]
MPHVQPDRVRAWDPGVPGIREVLHASWADHHYPAHTHDAWTLLIVDDGYIGYDVDRHRDRADAGVGVTLLPPHVTHDGHPLTSQGFRKRVVYLEESALPERLIGRCVDAPLVLDSALRQQVSALDTALAVADRAAAASHLALVSDVLRWHLNGRPELPPVDRRAGARLAAQARDILDADPVDAPSVQQLADRLEVSAAHLIRVFTREFAIPPHRYVTGRRLDLARRRLLDGDSPADVAVATGFYDQAHFHRHFTRLLRTSPGRFRVAA